MMYGYAFLLLLAKEEILKQRFIK